MTSIPDPWADASHILITPWLDPVVDERGHDPRSSYVERFWLPTIGPSSLWLIRYLAGNIEGSATPVPVDLDLLASALGIGHRIGRQSPLLRTMARVAHFGLARVADADTFEIRLRVPPLARRHVERLPRDLQIAHRRWFEDQLAPVPGDQPRRAQELALSLVELGESAADVELQLRRWRFAPSVCAEAATWAAQTHRARQLHPSTIPAGIPAPTS